MTAVRNNGRMRRPMATLVVALGLVSAGPSCGSPPEPVSPAATAELVEVWIVLSEPALATLPRDASRQRTALRTRIIAEQDRVMEQLRPLGAVETGRIQQVENAVAVRLPASALDAARRIDGVTSVRYVSDRNRLHE